VAAVLEEPVTADVVRELFGRGLVCAQVGGVVRGLFRLEVILEVAALPVDLHDLGPRGVALARASAGRSRARSITGSYTNIADHPDHNPAVHCALLPIKIPLGAARREMKTNSLAEIKMLSDRSSVLLLVERFYGILVDIYRATFGDVSDVDV